jgi:hypothetical protein
VILAAVAQNDWRFIEREGVSFLNRPPALLTASASRLVESDLPWDGRALSHDFCSRQWGQFFSRQIRPFLRVALTQGNGLFPFETGI